jgi:hypothetical protein
MKAGRRLTGEEYDREIVALHEALPESPNPQQDLELRRRELELTIDHKLGCDFPHQRREQLWKIQQQIEHKRVNLMIGHVVQRFLPGALGRMAAKLATTVVSEYAKVLNDEELVQYFGEDEVRQYLRKNDG